MTYPEKRTDLPLLLAVSHLQELWDVGRTTAYKRTIDPTFPEPLVFSGSSYRWWRDEVLDWFENQRASKTARRRNGVGPSIGSEGPQPLPAPRPVNKRKRAA